MLKCSKWKLSSIPPLAGESWVSTLPPRECSSCRARGTLAQDATDLLCRSWLLCKENLNVTCRRDPVSCFQQCGLCHSSLMKWSTETRATWKGDRAQPLVVSCCGIHQFKSNSSSLNIWTSISSGKCFTQRLLIKKDRMSLQIARKTVTTANPKWSETPFNSLDLVPHSVRGRA